MNNLTIKKIRGILMLLAAMSCLLGLSSCATCRGKAISEVEKISFGGGGGFTGAVDMYELSADGSLTHNGKPYGKVDCKTVRKLFKQAAAINTKQMTPGNTYQFVQIYKTTGSQYFAWAFGNGIDPALLQLSQDLRGLK